jgi:hypothetical protein
MSIEVVDGKGEPALDAKVVWHLGHGLDKAWVPVDLKGKVTLWAPPGETLVLRAVGSVCGQDNDVTVDEAKAGHRVTLRCHRWFQLLKQKKNDLSENLF